METSPELWQEADRSFVKASELELVFLEKSSEDEYRQALLERIETALRALWEEDPGRVMSLIYRIDVLEPKVERAFSSPDPMKALAEEVLARLRQTAASRIAYRKRQ